MIKNKINCIIGVVGDGFKKWKEEHGSWYRGLTKDDPRVAAIIAKARLTQIKNGKNKGSNNPMYGKLVHCKIGHRKDLGHCVRSSWEANFARILQYFQIHYEYEKHKFVLKNGETYTPDFFLPIYNKYYEIKGRFFNDKNIRFKEEFPLIKLKIINEKRYDKLMRKYSKYITVEDANSFYSKEEILNLFILYCEKLDSRSSVSKFCKELKISIKNIKFLFGSVAMLPKEVESFIFRFDSIRLKKKMFEYMEINGKKPTYKQLQGFYPRTAIILRKCFSGSYLKFDDWSNSE